MIWKKLGRIYNPLNLKRHEKLLTHTSNPTILKLSKDLVRVFYSGRDKSNRSSVGAFDFNMKKLTIENDFFKPFIIFGDKKSFYGDGISIGTISEINSKKYLYFMGWQNPKGEHWRGDIGRLGIETDETLIIDPLYPIIGKNKIDNISVSYPWILKLKDGFFHMWYGSTVSWDAGNNEMLHVINHAVSKDGYKWDYKGQAIPSKIGTAQAFSRPSVYETEDYNLHMWFSYRSGSGESYRIGYAIKEFNNDKWELKLDEAGIGLSEIGWDHEMIAYPCIFKYNENLYMFYNGNEYGKTGIGIAVMNDII
jgi:hypothetical protein